MENGNIIIYESNDGAILVDVRLENETVWLSQAQMADLFQKDRTVIGRHISNVFKEGELDENITCAKFAHMGIDGDQIYETKYYNLDVIISVGYRVKSPRGTQFRIWANKVLKEYLIKGYAVRENLTAQKYEELSQLVKLMGRTIAGEIGSGEQQEIISVIANYAYALDTLDGYDFQSLKIENTTPEEAFRASYDSAMQIIQTLKEKFGGSDLFAKEKDGSFRSSIGQIYQTWDGRDLYPSVEEKAAMLLYLVVKNHSFVDGNKRIAASLFLWFLQRNGILYNADGSKRISDGALVAMTLMIAESRADEKDTIIKVVVNLINKNN